MNSSGQCITQKAEIITLQQPRGRGSTSRLETKKEAQEMCLSSLWPAERCRSTPGRDGGVKEGVSGSEWWFTSLQAAIPLGQEQARRGLKATHTHTHTHLLMHLLLALKKKNTPQTQILPPDPWQQFSCHGTWSPNKIRVNIKQECLCTFPL